MPNSRATVRVRGRVQGVYFRAETRARATTLGVTGWVRNEPDGSLAAAFEGSRDRVESMIAWCRRGPRGARVDAVDVAWSEPEGDSGFLVR